VIAANTGTIEMRAGHLREAEVLLKSSTERERSLAGDSAAVAAAMSYYGRLLSETNRNAAAVGVLREASDMAAHYAGVDSPVAVQARVFLGEALLANGTRPEADTILRKTHDDALAHFPAAHPLTLRTTIGLGELAIADKDFAKAQGLLGDCTANLRKLGPPAASNLAFALTLLGDVEMQQGDVQGATSHFHEAVQIREKAPDDVWELAVAQERMGEALQKSGSDAALPLLKKAAAALEAQLGAAHPETLRARAALKPLAT
jgi:Tetratricopeptide repeat